MVETYTGKNSFALQARLRARVADMLAQVGDFGIERFDAGEVAADTIIQAVQSLPFLVEKKLIIISQLQQNSALLERIPELVDRTADGVDVVLVEPTLDKRKTYYKELQKLTSLQDFYEPKSHELPQWVVDYAKDLGGNISRGDAAYLVERVGAEQTLLAREIEKLVIYDETITRNTIDILTDQSVQSSIFNLLDAAFSGNSEKVLALYREQRRARVEPQYIIAMLTWQLISLTQAVYAKEKTEHALVELGQSPFTAKKSVQLARSMNKSKVRETIKKLSELDAEIKTSADADAGLELFLLELTSS